MRRGTKKYPNNYHIQVKALRKVGMTDCQGFCPSTTPFTFIVWWMYLLLQPECCFEQISVRAVVLKVVNRCAVRAPVFDLELPEEAKDFERIRFQLQDRFTAPTRQSPHVERESDQSTRERLSPTQQFSTNLGEEARFHECFAAFAVLSRPFH